MHKTYGSRHETTDWNLPDSRRATASASAMGSRCCLPKTVPCSLSSSLRKQFPCPAGKRLTVPPMPLWRARTKASWPAEKSARCKAQRWSLKTCTKKRKAASPCAGKWKYRKRRKKGKGLPPRIPSAPACHRPLPPPTNTSSPPSSTATRKKCVRRPSRPTWTWNACT